MRRPAFFTVPATIIRLAFGEMGTVVLDGQRVSARRLEDLGFKFSFPDAEVALRDLLGRRATPVAGKGG
jgi:NAD dependent epimerase/dehydratase family enzyme